MPSETNTGVVGGPSEERRRFLQTTATTAMIGGLAAGYGTLAVLAGKFLYPTDDHAQVWQFVAGIDELSSGESRAYVAPDGAQIVIARHSAEEFIALSSVCPHLGCQVHWEAQGQRFFCPCHNGAFDAAGRPISGPPAKGGQSLARFPLKVEKGLLYILVHRTRVGASPVDEG